MHVGCVYLGGFQQFFFACGGTSAWKFLVALLNRAASSFFIWRGSGGVKAPSPWCVSLDEPIEAREDLGRRNTKSGKMPHFFEKKSSTTSF